MRARERERQSERWTAYSWLKVEFRVQGLGSRSTAWKFWASGISDFGFRFSVFGFQFSVQGLGFRV